MEDKLAGKIDFPSWIKNHTVEKVEPIVEAGLKYLREERGIKRVGAVGYCFGGKVGLSPYSFTSLFSCRDPN